MKKITLFLLILTFVFSATFVIAEEDEKVEIPEGMELIKSGTVKILVPKGAKVTEADGLIRVEDIGAYVGRRFLEIEERLEEIEAKEKKLEKEVEQLKKALDKMRGSS